MPDERPKQTARVILSIPLTPDLKADLERRAGRRPVSAYAREMLFPANDNSPQKPRTARHGGKSRQALAALLAKLGATQTSSSLQELARFARLGALHLTPETEAAIQKACADIAEMKALLMKAMRVRER